MTDWWEGVEAALAAHSVEAPDPWAELADELPVLTDQQRSFLEQLAAQPQPTRPGIDDDPNTGHSNDDGRDPPTWTAGRRPG